MSFVSATKRRAADTGWPSYKTPRQATARRRTAIQIAGFASAVGVPQTAQRVNYGPSAIKSGLPASRRNRDNN
jgi:hypothetical protein